MNFAIIILEVGLLVSLHHYLFLSIALQISLYQNDNNTKARLDFFGAQHMDQSPGFTSTVNYILITTYKCPWFKSGLNEAQEEVASDFGGR